MSRSASSPPELLPILSRGRHRNSSRGACFMELASVLAGERWSDHPRCTHPLLAELARLVNDATSDEGRHLLAVHIPSVVGMNSDDLRMDARIAHRCATTAFPVVSEERQKALAVAVLTADHVVAGLDGTLASSLAEDSRRSLAAAPGAAEWGREFVRRGGVTVKGFRRVAAPTTVRVSVQGIAEACIPDPDGMLRQLLTNAINDCAGHCCPSAPVGAAAAPTPVAAQATPARV